MAPTIQSFMAAHDLVPCSTPFPNAVGFPRGAPKSSCRSSPRLQHLKNRLNGIQRMAERKALQPLSHEFTFRFGGFTRSTIPLIAGIAGGAELLQPTPYRYIPLSGKHPHDVGDRALTGCTARPCMARSCCLANPSIYLSNPFSTSSFSEFAELPHTKWHCTQL